MRRKLIYVFLAVLVVGLLVACEEMARLSVSPTVLNFGEEDTGKSFTIENTGVGDQDLNWNATVNADWAVLNKTSGTNDAVVNVTVDREGLDPGVHNATVNITSNGGNAEVGLIVVVPGDPAEALPRLSVSPTVLNFGEEETVKTFAISNTGAEGLEWVLAFDVDWLEVDVTTGTDDAVITVTVDRANKDEGVYDATINITSNGGDAEVGATMFIQGEAFSVSPTSLNFGKSLTELTFEVENRRPQDLNWTIVQQGEGDWVTFAPATGTNNGLVTVTVDRDGVDAGEYFSYLKVSSDAGNVWVSLFMEVVEEDEEIVDPNLPDMVNNVYLRGITAPEGTVSYGLDMMAFSQVPYMGPQVAPQTITLDEVPEPTMMLPYGYEAGFVLSWDPVDDVDGYNIYWMYIYDGQFFLELFQNLPVEALEDPNQPTYAFVDDWYWVGDIEIFAVLAYNEYGESPLPDYMDIPATVRSFWDWGMIIAPLYLASPADGTTASATPTFVWTDEWDDRNGYSLYLLQNGDLYWENVFTFEVNQYTYPGTLPAGGYDWHNLAYGYYCGTNPYDIGYPLGLSLSKTWGFTVE